MSCEEVRNELPLLLYGELGFDDEERIERHLDGCAECAAEFARLRAMVTAADAARLDPSTADLVAARERLFSALVTETGVPWWHRVLAGWRQPVAATGLMMVGFGVGHLPVFQPKLRVGEVATRDVSRPTATKVRFVQAGDDGKVRMVIDEIYQRPLTGAAEDPEIRGLLVSAAREADDAGVRSETISLLRGQTDWEPAREAILFAAQYDRHPSVRLQAIQGLGGFVRSDPETQTVMIQVLLRDNDPAVRTMVIEAFGAQPQPEVAGALQRVLVREQNESVRKRCVRTLQAMRASTDVY